MIILLLVVLETLSLQVGIMITRYFLRVLICCGIYVIIQTMPKTLAIKRTSDVEEYMIGEQRTRRRQNYVQQVAMEKEVFDNVGNEDSRYDSASETDERKEELPAFIVDYANMIRNDIILLDNSVETRTRKRGNIQVEKYNQVIHDVPCSCDYKNEEIDMGENFYPRTLYQRSCKEEICKFPYNCKPLAYELTVFKRRTSANEETLEDFPNDLSWRWVAVKQNITTSCVCTKDYLREN